MPRHGDIMTSPLFAPLRLLRTGASAHHDRAAVPRARQPPSCWAFPSMPGVGQSRTRMLLFTGTMELVGGALIVVGLLTAAGRLHPVGLHGRRLFHGPCPARLLPARSITASRRSSSASSSSISPPPVPAPGRSTRADPATAARARRRPRGADLALRWRSKRRTASSSVRRMTLASTSTPNQWRIETTP